MNGSLDFDFAGAFAAVAVPAMVAQEIKQLKRRSRANVRDKRLDEGVMQVLYYRDI
jgi:hypothetical protein